MIKIRLLKSRAGDFSQLLDSAEVPELEDLSDLHSIIKVVGLMMKPYAESMIDPNIIPMMDDPSVENWTVGDLESIKYELSTQGFDLIITKETGEDLNMTSSQVKFLIVDSTTKDLGYFPYGDSRVFDLKDAVDSLSVIDAVGSIIEMTNLFDPKKFNNDPIRELLSQLDESRKVLGSLNVSAMSKLNTALLRLNRKIYAFSLA